MKNNKQKNNLFTIIIITLVFSLFGGTVAFFITKTLLDNDGFAPYYWGEINLTNPNLNRPIVITGAKNVVIEYEEKVSEIIQKKDKIIIGLYKKNNKEDDIYYLDSNIKTGLALTSDGWVIFPKYNLPLEDLKSNYIAITKDKKILEIDELVTDNTIPFVFLHLKDINDLNVTSFTNQEDITPAKNIILTGWEDKAYYGYLNNINKTESHVISSDKPSIETEIFTLNKEKDNLIVFDLTGKAIGLQDDNKLIKLSDYRSLINNFLKTKEIHSLSLGINYINLENTINPNNKNLNGALIAKDKDGVSIKPDSLAEKYGLEENDIIISIDNLTIGKNHEIFDILNNYLPNDNIILKVKRSEEEENINVKLE